MKTKDTGIENAEVALWIYSTDWEAAKVVRKNELEGYESGMIKIKAPVGKGYAYQVWRRITAQANTKEDI